MMRLFENKPVDLLLDLTDELKRKDELELVCGSGISDRADELSQRSNARIGLRGDDCAGSGFAGAHERRYFRTWL